MSETLREAWGRVSQHESWIHVRSAITPLMPMPGSIEFDDDIRFKEFEIFPGVFVRDSRWPFPREWGPNPDLTVAQDLSFNFDVELGNGSNLLDERNEEKLMAAKRLLYLILFQPFQRPLSLSTLRMYRRTVFEILKWIENVGSEFGILRLQDLNDYAVLADCINSLSRSQRKSIPRLYAILRWWRSKSESSYKFFVPPPTIEALSNSAEFNPENVREDAEPGESALWQPLPDRFVAEAGAIWLDYTEKTLPYLLTLLKEIRRTAEIDKQGHKKAAELVLSAAEWPVVCFPFKPPKSLGRLVSVVSSCQLSALQLLSLAVGPRWAEVKSMRITCCTTKRLNGETQYILDARTFKFSKMASGAERHWPIAPILGKILLRQAELAKCVNGEDWPYLWFSLTLSLFDGGLPLKQIAKLLHVFARRHGLVQFLEGTSFHHHRFRKTVARLVVIALNGGPLILRELFGHEDLTMTMRYILANPDLRDDLRRVAEAENRLIANKFMGNAETMLGGGADYFREVLRRAREEISVLIPAGKKDQKDLTINDLIDFISSEPEGIQIKQVLPGVIGCVKPLSENGQCTRPGELPDVALCSKSCRWHLLIDEGGREIARGAVRDALANYNAARNSLGRQFWKRIIEDWIKEYPDLKVEFRGKLTHVIKKHGNRSRNKKKA